MQQDKKFWPEANSTLRISYGKIRGMKPRDGVTYSFQSTLEGILQKNAGSNPTTGFPKIILTWRFRRITDAMQ
jgi:hypothetical protein